MRLPLDLSFPSTSASKPDASSFIVNEATNELLLIELQGELNLEGTEHDDADSRSAKSGARVGRLDLSVPGRPMLFISHHRLVGKIVNLNTPMGVLKHTVPPTLLKSLTASNRKAGANQRFLDGLADTEPASSPAARAQAGEKRMRPSSSSIALQAGAVDGDDVGGAENDEERTPKRQITSAASASHQPPQIPTHDLDENTTPQRNLGSSTSDLTAPSISDKPSATPLNVSELTRGKHEVVAIIWRKIIFSKRPEPMTMKDVESEEEGGEVTVA